MTLRNTPDRFGSISIGLHWVTLIVLIGVYACINLTDLYPKGSEPREALKTWHFMLGLTVLLLVALRLVNRLAGASPPRWSARRSHCGSSGWQAPFTSPCTH